MGCTMFCKVSDLKKIDIIEGSLNLMVSSNSSKDVLDGEIRRIDNVGHVGD